jgi:hypothetical protein
VDHPNMSYCMNENTLAALDQIMAAMDEQGAVGFLKDLSRTERDAFESLAQLCRQFHLRAERAIDAELDEIEALRG